MSGPPKSRPLSLALATQAALNNHQNKSVTKRESARKYDAKDSLERLWIFMPVRFMYKTAAIKIPTRNADISSKPNSTTSVAFVFWNSYNLQFCKTPANNFKRMKSRTRKGTKQKDLSWSIVPSSSSGHWRIQGGGQCSPPPPPPPILDFFFYQSETY